MLNINQFHLSFQKDEAIMNYIKSNPIMQIQSHINTIILIDFEHMPIVLRESLILWLIHVNLNRIENGQKMLITMELISKFPYINLIRKFIVKIDRRKTK